MTTAADDRTNTLIVVGPSDTLKLVEKVLTALDSDQTAMSEVHVFHMQYVDAAAAAKLLNTIFQPEDTTTGGAAAAGGGGGANRTSRRWKASLRSLARAR